MPVTMKFTVNEILLMATWFGVNGGKQRREDYADRVWNQSLKLEKRLMAVVRREERKGERKVMK